MSKKLTQEEAEQRCIQAHPDKYSSGIYSLEKFKYIHSQQKSVFICNVLDDNGNIHGEFEQTINSYINNKTPCSKCAKEILIKRNKLHNIQTANNNKETFKHRANCIHNNKFKYLTPYTHIRNPIIIQCRVCNHIFPQRPDNHLNGRGCPKCNSSKGEKQISKILDVHNISYIQEHTFSDLKDKYVLRYDIYIPDHNLCIEYNGIQHYRPIDFSGKRTYKQMITKFLNNIKRDNIKKQYCIDNGIRFLEIPYWDFDKIEELIMSKTVDIRI